MLAGLIILGVSWFFACICCDCESQDDFCNNELHQPEILEQKCCFFVALKKFTTDCHLKPGTKNYPIGCCLEDHPNQGMLCVLGFLWWIGLIVVIIGFIIFIWRNPAKEPTTPPIR
jgi:hypothetical protein